MNQFNEYQEFTKSLAVYNEAVVLLSPQDQATLPRPTVMSFMYPLLALGEEAGEVQGKVAKFIRKSAQGVTEEQLETLRTDVAKELGDLMYQVSETARQFGFTLQEIVDMNVEKLKSRQERGVLVGEGDNR
jgi:NTP pyrophosphatase (non-canonical NTP hydrolase)